MRVLSKVAVEGVVQGIEVGIGVIIIAKPASGEINATNDRAVAEGMHETSIPVGGNSPAVVVALLVYT